MPLQGRQADSVFINMEQLCKLDEELNWLFVSAMIREGKRLVSCDYLDDAVLNRENKTPFGTSRVPPDNEGTTFAYRLAHTSLPVSGALRQRGCSSGLGGVVK